MKALLIGFFALVLANTGFAESVIDSALTFDGLTLGALLLIGVVCLAVARKRVA